MICKCFSIMDCRTNCLANHRQYGCNILYEILSMISQMLFIWCGFVSIFDNQRNKKKHHTRSLQTRTKLTVIFKKDVLYNIFSSCCVFADCKSGWKRYNGHCYYLFKTKLNWFDAQVNLAGFLLSSLLYAIFINN